MKISLLQIVTIYQSLASILNSKLQLLSQQSDIDLYVVSSARESDEDRKCAGHFYAIHMARTLNLVSDIISIVKIYRYVKKHKLDIIHTHSAKAGMLGGIAGWLAGIPVIHSYHGLPFYKGQNKWKYSAFKFGETLLALFRSFLFSQNNEDFETLQQIKFIKKKLLFEGNGVNPDLIEANALSNRNNVRDFFVSDKPHILCISRLESIKALDKLLAMVKFCKENNFPVECIIAGKGALQNFLKQKISDCDLEDSIRIVYSPYIHSLIEKADIVVLTSKKEGIPRGILEAMALKKPVVATNVQGTKEVVIDKETGLLVPFHDQDALNRAIYTLLKDKTLQEKYGNAGYIRVLKSFSNEEEIVRLWVQTYHQILKSHCPIPDAKNQKPQKNRVLFVTTVGYTIEAFLIPYIKLFLQNNFNVVALANWKYKWNKLPDFIEKVSIPFSRKLTSPLNVIALFQLTLYLKREQFLYIYTHTPIASVLVRLAKLLSRSNARVIYEIHGLHIHGRGKRITNILFGFIESALASYTEKIITINQDDFSYAYQHFTKSNIFYSPGIGVDLHYYTHHPNNRIAARQKYAIDINETVIITIADFIKRKRIDLCLDVAKRLLNQGNTFKWLLVGDGLLRNSIMALIETLGLQNCFIILGHQNDVRSAISASDIFVLLSMQEGLPRSILEAGAMELPAVVSDIRGNRDIIKNGENSFLVEFGDVVAAARAVKLLIENPTMRHKFGAKLKTKIQNQFSIEKTLSIHEKIFFMKTP
jgi:glycosyltransferase involved in cell wall biosynthesis